MKKPLTSYYLQSLFLGKFNQVKNIPFIAALKNNHEKIKRSKRRKAIVYSILALLFATIIGLIFLLKDLPSPRRLTHSDNYAVSTQIFDRNGLLLYEIFADENRIPVEISTLPEHVYQASISIEDKNFYNHFGFDIFGIIRALKANISGGRIEGGSTITQQLVKNGLLTRERTIKRKAKEAVIAVFTEVLYTKAEILEMYLNYISYGGTSVGIEAASNRYFDKHARELTLPEAALLAGLPKAPSTYSPFGSNPEDAKDRQLEVLRRMREDGYITEDEEKEAANTVLNYAISQTDINAPHFVFFVRDFLYKEYGVDMVEKGGLRVTTTLDLDLHNTAQASLSAEIANLSRYRVGNGAALVVKPNTGEILSMIGSKDYFNATDEGQVNVTLANRQPGSSIKPIMYATAFQKGALNPGSFLIDTPTCFTAPGQKKYCPRNYDGSFKGPTTIRSSLGNSLNIPAVKGVRIIGVEEFISQATKMGITTWTDPANYGLSLTLGGGEVKMIDLVQSFSVIANMGVKTPLTPILKIEDYKGTLIAKTDFEQRKKDLATLTEFDAEKTFGELERVMDKGPAYMTADIMQDNNARAQAFGNRSELVIPNKTVSAKTGTTNDLKDNWTVGFTPDFLVMTWVGNNDSSPMNRNIVSGVTGATPIFNDIMTYLLKDTEYDWYEKPEDVIRTGVCPSGFPPAKNGSPCGIKSTDLYWEGSKPTKSTFIKQDFWIDPRTGLPPKFGEQVDGLVLENHTYYSDPLTKIFCVDCNRAVTEDGKTIYEQQVVPHDFVVEVNNE
jgi:penicillin-binding protein 1C